tara:strand:- start:352 stop:1026 length:675 start_codon:yes stop_codon:yes gene_type:complete
VLGFLASIPGNIADQFKPEQVTKLKAIAKERDPISTLQTGPMDPNAYGAIGGDRFDVEEDVFQSTSPNVETVYTPGTPLDNYLKQQEINERDYPLLKKLKDRENIAQEVEDATEQVVPGSFNLEKFGPDEFGKINIFGADVDDETDVAQNLSIEEYKKIKEGAPYMADEAIKQIYGPDALDDIPLIGYAPTTTAADGGYLNKFDDGGYANMSTFEKLKMINYGE